MHPQELEVGPRSGPYLLVMLIMWTLFWCSFQKVPATQGKIQRLFCGGECVLVIHRFRLLSFIETRVEIFSFDVQAHCGSPCGRLALWSHCGHGRFTYWILFTEYWIYCFPPNLLKKKQFPAETVRLWSLLYTFPFNKCIINLQFLQKLSHQKSCWDKTWLSSLVLGQD